MGDEVIKQGPDTYLSMYFSMYTGRYGEFGTSKLGRQVWIVKPR